MFFLSISLPPRLAVLFFASLAALATTWSVMTSDDVKQQQDKTRASANQRGTMPSAQFIIQAQPRLRMKRTMARDRSAYVPSHNIIVIIMCMVLPIIFIFLLRTLIY